MSASTSARDGADVTVASYLIEQCIEHGIDTFFLVPGDYA